jgi:two-component system, chemotaxis family, chemotaxis protein CheY
MIRPTKWILVVEDEESVRRSICEILKSHFGDEIKLVESSDGADAMTKIKNQTFHLIITDMQMPKKTGGELVDVARSDGFNETTPIIIISGFESVNIEKKYKFVSFIPKPLDAYEFAKVVRNLFSIGSTEKMISASIFNSLLDASVAFLTESLKRKDFDVGKMVLKNRGTPLEAEHAAIITVLIGKVSNTFSVLCSAETLNKIRNGSEKISGSTLDVICRSLGYVILKHVLSDCGIIDSNQVHTKDITQDPALLTDKRGIVVPITSQGLDYKIFATTQGGD